MKITFQRIYTSDGIELHGILYMPIEKTQRVLLHIHGMGGNFYENKFIDYLTQTLTDSGIAFCVFNNRGAELVKDFIKIPENSTVRIGSAYEKFEDCLIDIKTYIDYLEHLGFDNIHLSGHSLGSPKVAYYVSKTGDKRIRSISFISPSDMLGLVRQNKKSFQEDLTEARKLVENNEGNKLLSRQVWDQYPISANTYLSLFEDNSEASIFNFYNLEDSFEVLKKIKVPVFAIMGRKDDALVVSIEETFSKLKLVLSSCPLVETKILGEATHGYRGYEQLLADEIKKWINALYVSK